MLRTGSFSVLLEGPTRESPRHGRCQERLHRSVQAPIEPLNRLGIEARTFSFGSEVPDGLDHLIDRVRAPAWEIEHVPDLEEVSPRDVLKLSCDGHLVLPRPVVVFSERDVEGRREAPPLHANEEDLPF